MANRTQPTKPEPDAEWLTVPEVCWVMRKSLSYVYARLHPRHPHYIESKLLGRSRLVNRAALDAYLAAQPTERAA